MAENSPHRITVTLPPHTHATLKKIAAGLGTSQSTIVAEMIEAADLQLGDLAYAIDKLAEQRAAHKGALRDVLRLGLREQIREAERQKPATGSK